jgi:hypothetical protein
MIIKVTAVEVEMPLHHLEAISNRFVCLLFTHALYPFVCVDDIYMSVSSLAAKEKHHTKN